VNTFQRTEPWYFTEEVLRRYLAKAAPYLTGRLLDVGCGRKRYKDLFQCTDYIGLESMTNFTPDVVGDVRILPFATGSIDSVLSNQVLEHVDDTMAAMAELSRVLKPGGYLCITVPFIGRLHGVPCDYWRFSEYGLRYLFKKHGFEPVVVEGMGGFFTTQAFLWIFWTWERCATNRVGMALRPYLMRLMNCLALLAHRLDRDTTTPFNYLAVGRRLSRGESSSNTHFPYDQSER
jgi:SAM-dependent methyltransferase